jgi:hypothetical protein
MCAGGLRIGGAQAATLQPWIPPYSCGMAMGSGVSASVGWAGSQFNISAMGFRAGTPCGSRTPSRPRPVLGRAICLRGVNLWDS